MEGGRAISANEHLASGASGRARPLVCYIAASGRSGSTLLERLVAERLDAVGVGELRYIWERGALGNELCGCRASFNECPFWQAVLANMARSGPLMPDVWSQWAVTVNRTRRLPGLLWPGLATPWFRKTLAAYRATLPCLYSAVAETAGRRVLVDSSKYAPYALALLGTGEILTVVVHLVRDSRAVVNSWQRVRARPEVHQREALMDRPSPSRAALSWDAQNVADELIASRYPHYLRVRYEDLVTHPEETVEHIVAACRRLDPAIVTTGNAGPLLHSVAGNPVRFTHDGLTIAADTAWRAELGTAPRRLTTALTLPLLLRYDYSLR